MKSKTPKFDSALNELFEKMTPKTVFCKWSGKHENCENKFEVTQDDIKFLKKLRAPMPNFCPTCRRMRRFVHFNNTRFFKYVCQAPSHSEQMISIYPEETPFPVYDYRYLSSDDFDPFIFGKPYNPAKDILSELFDLRKKFPLPSFLNRDPSSVNSEYTNGGRNNKNCYYAFASYSSEDVWYTVLPHKSRNIMDSLTINESELIYNSVQTEYSYKSSFLYFSSHCADSMFLFDCKNCTDCFGCVNLRGGRYMVFNEQYSKDEYDTFLESIYPLSRDKLKLYEDKFWQMVRTLPVNSTRNLALTDSIGANLRNCKNLFDCNNSKNSENVRYADMMIGNSDSMDVALSGGNSSLLYMTANIGSQSSNVKFSISSKFCTDCEYVFNSKNLNNCFMCFGLQDKSFCILNLQYDEEEYYRIVDEIKTRLLQEGKYGDGVGFEFSGQAYNFSVAGISFHLNKSKIIELGGYYGEEPEVEYNDIDILEKDQVPVTIKEVSNDILTKAIRCEISGRPFRIVPSELEFYRQMKLPLPLTHPSVRIEKNLRVIPFALKYKKICRKCDKEIFSIFDPSFDLIDYCESCYQKEVY